MRPHPDTVETIAPVKPNSKREIKPTREDYEEFEKALARLINKHSLENGSNTPDFILAAYLTNCLKAFNKASRRREKWYGKSLSI